MYGAPKFLRLKARWRQWQDNDDFPSFICVDREEIEDMWQYCFVLELLAYGEDPVVRMVGDALADYIP
ncbi:MAG: hypothetical protein VW709_22130 [Rickettsiales bacterium]|jgi:hypothetical protein